MRRLARKHNLFMMLAVVLLFGCTDETLVSPDVQQAIDPSVTPAAALVQAEVPFKGICVGEVVLANGVIANVSGNGTLIGHFTGQLYDDMRVVLRAPDGSELHADITPKPTGDGGIGTVTGGTGRFEHATGQWESTWQEETSTGWIETFVGQISSVGSNRQ